MTDVKWSAHRKKMLRRMAAISREVATWLPWEKNVQVPHHLHEAQRLEGKP